MGPKVIIQLLASAITGVLVFFILTLSARLFGPEILGQAAYFTGILGLIFAFTDLGLSRAHIHFTAVKAGEPEVATFLSLKLPLLFLAAIVAGVISRVQSLPLVFIVLLLVEIFSRIADSILISFEGQERAWPQNLLGIAVKCLRLVAVIIFGWRLTTVLGYSLTFFIEAAALFIGALVLGRHWFKFRPTRESVRRYVRYGLPFAVIIPLSYLQDNSLILMLKHWRGATELGIFTASFGLFGFLKTFSSSLMTFFFPRISRLHQQADFVKIQAYTDMAVKLLVWILVPVLGLLLALSSWLVPLILGPEFAAAVGIFRWYLLGIFVLAVFAPYDHVLFATSNQRSVMGVNLISTVILLFLGWWLIPAWGGQGAAVTSVSVWLISGVWQFMVLRQKTGINFLHDWRLSGEEVKYLYGLFHSFSQAVIRSGRKKIS